MTRRQPRRQNHTSRHPSTWCQSHPTNCASHVRCPACHGTGRESSEEGQSVMDFAVRHLDSMKFRKTIATCREVSPVRNTASKKNPHWADRLSALATIMMLAGLEIGFVFFLAHECPSDASLQSMDVWGVVEQLGLPKKPLRRRINS